MPAGRGALSVKAYRRAENSRTLPENAVVTLEVLSPNTPPRANARPQTISGCRPQGSARREPADQQRPTGLRASGGRCRSRRNRAPAPCAPERRGGDILRRSLTGVRSWSARVVRPAPIQRGCCRGWPRSKRYAEMGWLRLGAGLPLFDRMQPRISRTSASRPRRSSTRDSRIIVHINDRIDGLCWHVNREAYCTADVIRRKQQSETYRDQLPFT